MAGEYLLNWTDDGTEIPSKTPMVLTINTKDTTRTPIVLVGKGTPNYGEQLLENMLHILENFASAEPPQIKTVGMVWYNHGESLTDVGAGLNLSNLPFQTRSKNLNYYDGTVWVELLTKEDLARYHNSLLNGALGNYAEINSDDPKTGDIYTDEAGRIFIRSTGAWKMVWPTLVSDLYLDTKSLNSFVGVKTTNVANGSSFKGFGALYGTGYGDVGFGQTKYLIDLIEGNFKTTLVEKDYLITLANAILDVATFLNNNHIKDKASEALAYLHTTTNDAFYPANYEIFDRITLDQLYGLANSKTKKFSTQLVLTDSANAPFQSATSSTPVTIKNLSTGPFVATYNIDFGTADSARAFFNSGGELRFKLTYTPAVTTEDKIFKNFVDKKTGVLSLSAHDTVCTGGKMTLAPALQTTSVNDDSGSYGYYELPTWTGVDTDYGVALASTNFGVGIEISDRVDYTVYACSYGPSTNGANGASVRVSLVFSHNEAAIYNNGSVDVITPPGYGTGYGVSGVVLQTFNPDAIIAKAGIASRISIIKAASPFTIDTPTVTLPKNFK